MADEPDALGGPDRPSRSDLDLYAQALRNDWPVPPAVRKQILQACVNIIAARDDDEGPPLDADGKPDVMAMIAEAAGKPSTRDTLAAVRCIAALCGLSLRQQQVDIQREALEMRKKVLFGGGGKSALEVIEAAEKIALERRRDRAESVGAGEAAGDPG